MADDDPRSEQETRSLSKASGSHVPFQAGRMLGRYAVLEEIGHGGMGRVLRVYDPKLEREVAVKLVRSDLLDADGQDRLIREARAMARLSHPNVVAVHDVDDTRKGVMLVMELVRGETLRAWLRRPRPWREIIARLVEAGRGLSAAHREGLLHRDFKPGNVLVPEEGAAKVTDFGLAKLATDDESSTSVGHSRSPDSLDDSLSRGGTILGSPRYMAPEQQMGHSVGPAMDQYAFCVTLWEALVNEPPFGGAWDELLKQKLTGPPPWPEEIDVPEPIVGALRRGLRPDPDARWASIDDLLGVLDYDPSRARRRWVAAGGVAAMLALGGTVGYGYLRARGERCSGALEQLEGTWDDERREEARRAVLATELPYAPTIWERLEPRLDEHATSWTDTYTEACAATTIRGEQSTEVLDRRMKCLQLAKIELQAVVEVLVSADAQLLSNAHEVVEGLGSPERCSSPALLREDVEPPPPGQESTVERIRRALALSRARREAGWYDQAKASVDEASAMLDALAYDPLRVAVELERGFVLELHGEYDASEAALMTALELGAKTGQWDAVRQAATKLMFVVGRKLARPQQALRYRELALGLAGDELAAQALVYDVVGSVLHTQGELGEAEAAHRKALDLQLRAHGPEHFEVARSHNNLANLLMERNEYAEAEVEHRRALAIRERALGAEHPEAALSRTNLGNTLNALGRYDEAEVEHRRALELIRHTLDPENPRVVAAVNNLAIDLALQGQHAEATQEFQHVLDLRLKQLGPEHPRVAEARYNLALTLSSLGELAKAREEVQRALEVQVETLGPDHPNVATMRSTLASFLSELGQHAEAEAELLSVIAALEAASELDHEAAADAYANLAASHAQQDEPAEAETAARRALALRQELLDPDHPKIATSRRTLAEILLDQGRFDEALPLAEASWVRHQRDDISPEQRGRTAFTFARALWEADADRDRARALAKDARTALEKAQPPETKRASEVSSWLREHQ